MELILIIICAAMAAPWFKVRTLTPAAFPGTAADQFWAWHRVRMRSLNLFATAAVSGASLMAAAYFLGYKFGRTIPEWLVLGFGVPVAIGWIVLVIMAFTAYSSARTLAQSAGLHHGVAV